MKGDYAKRAAEPLRRIWRKVSERELGIYPIAHQGIQRSGTNFFCSLLNAADYRIVNRIDPPRGNPRHKHHRWQEDKSTIVMDARYSTKYAAKTLQDVNKICDYPDDMRHLVLFRHPRGWIDSIYRWGKKNGWFTNETEFFDRTLYQAYLNEWHGFYSSWERFSQTAPDQVMFVCYEDLIRDPQGTIARIDSFSKVVRTQNFTLPSSIEKVRHSKPMTVKREGLNAPELDDAAAQIGAFNWPRYILSETVA